MKRKKKSLFLHSDKRVPQKELKESQTILFCCFGSVLLLSTAFGWLPAHLWRSCMPENHHLG